MVEPTVVLVHSPFVGPSTWWPVAAELTARGRSVAVPSLVNALSSPTPLHDALTAAVTESLDESDAESIVLVAHSGAGALIPSIAAGARCPTTAAVLVDAALPQPGRSWCDIVPARLADQAHRMAGPNGLLAPWHEWFPPEVVIGLVPDDEARAQFCAEVPRVPLRYLTERAPARHDWQRFRCGYLSLSPAYAQNAVDAAGLGWPVAQLDGHHLSLLTDPAAVTDAIVELLERR